MRLSGIFLSLFLTTILSGQIKLAFPDARKVDTSLLMLFMNAHQRPYIDTSTIRHDLQQIENIGLYYDLSYSLDTVGTDTIIQYYFREKQSFIPFFNIGLIPDEQLIQIGLQEFNFLRRLQTFGAHATYYDRWSFSAYYNAPFINNSRFGFSTVLNSFKTKEPFTFRGIDGTYLVDRNYFELGGQYYFGWNNYFNLAGGILRERFEQYQTTEITNLPNLLNTEKYVLKSQLVLGQINYNWSYESGFQTSATYQLVLSDVNDPFQELLVSNIYKRRMGKINLATRLRFGISQNVDSPFVPFVFDSYINVRGVGNRIFRGTAELCLNVELRYPFYDNGKLAMQAVMFSDNGWMRPAAGDFQRLERAHFAGIGYRLYLYKFYGLVLRVDYGFNMNPISSGDFIFGMGQYF